jgi:hypothetical protein
MLQSLSQGDKESLKRSGTARGLAKRGLQRKPGADGVLVETG